MTNPLDGITISDGDNLRTLSCLRTRQALYASTGSQYLLHERINRTMVVMSSSPVYSPTPFLAHSRTSVKPPSRLFPHQFSLRPRPTLPEPLFRPAQSAAYPQPCHSSRPQPLRGEMLRSRPRQGGLPAGFLGFLEAGRKTALETTGGIAWCSRESVRRCSSMIIVGIVLGTLAAAGGILLGYWMGLTDRRFEELFKRRCRS